MDPLTNNELGTAKRFDQGKTRYDLLPAFTIDQLAQVLTMGAAKYGENNYLNGMKWSKVIGSLKRHLAAIELGEDYDKESGLLHSSHVLANAAFLTEYYKIYPQGDDRWVKPPVRIGLDIDEVLCNWLLGWKTRWNIEAETYHWNFDRQAPARFKQLIDSGEYEEFLLNLPPLIDGKDLKFEPVCYVTARSCRKEIVEQWLDKHNFPVAPVEVVELGGSKVEAIKKHNVDIFVDDNYKNFTEINASGTLCYLFDHSYNRKYEVGHLRLKSLNDIK